MRFAFFSDMDITSFRLSSLLLCCICCIRECKCSGGDAFLPQSRNLANVDSFQELTLLRKQILAEQNRMTLPTVAKLAGMNLEEHPVCENEEQPCRQVCQRYE